MSADPGSIRADSHQALPNLAVQDASADPHIITTAARTGTDIELRIHTSIALFDVAAEQRFPAAAGFAVTASCTPSTRRRACHGICRPRTRRVGAGDLLNRRLRARVLPRRRRPRAAATVRPSRKVRRPRRSALAVSRTIRHPDSRSTTPQPAPATVAPQRTAITPIHESVNPGWNELATMYGRDVNATNTTTKTSPTTKPATPKIPLCLPTHPSCHRKVLRSRQPRSPAVPQRTYAALPIHSARESSSQVRRDTSHPSPGTADADTHPPPRSPQAHGLRGGMVAQRIGSNAAPHATEISA